MTKPTMCFCKSVTYHPDGGCYKSILIQKWQPTRTVFDRVLFRHYDDFLAALFEENQVRFEHEVRSHLVPKKLASILQPSEFLRAAFRRSQSSEVLNAALSIEHNPALF